jgi:dTDP-4-amino-4,6-dideoxygalactose transaminase
LSLRLANVEHGDEVIVPTLTFIATVNAVSYNGANPVFMDADRYYNLDVEKTIQFIHTETVFRDGATYNKNTKKRIAAIVPVHVWGNAAWLDELVPLCEERNIPLVEDACESLGTVYNTGKYSGRHTGTIGRLGCLSFNGNKIITTGGGGMILTDDEDLAEKTRYFTTQAKDDQVRYIHNEIGYNFRLTNIQAAMGMAQMEQLKKFLDRKREIFQHYQASLQVIEGLKVSNVPVYADNNHWMNVLQIDHTSKSEDMELLMQQLEKHGIQSRPVWNLNHLQKPYRHCQNYRIERAEELVKKSLCLPSSPKLEKCHINKIISQLVDV